MICYRCGCLLSEKDYCTSCGAEVGMYKQLLALSNRYYNDALEKAGVRDLSGAIISLKESIKLNKNNVDARNLLGLIYFEIGEVVEALGQWIISQNIRPSKNIGSDYINLIQENTARLDAMDQNLKKYNQALRYCYQDSLDYATIQLKKLLSGAPKYLKARQLLALIYIKNEDWERAYHEIEKCKQIDTGNTITMRYEKEVLAMLTPVDAPKNKNSQFKLEASESAQRFQHDNELIIQPLNKQSPKTTMLALYVILGIIVGIAVTYFLVVPASMLKANESAQEKITSVSDEKDKKTAELDSLKIDYAKLQTENEELKESLENYQGTDGNIGTTDALMLAADVYLTDPDDIEGIASDFEALEAVSTDTENQYSTAFYNLYNKLLNRVSGSLAQYYYERGYSNYQSESYEAALPDLERAYRYNKSNSDALFYLGNSYRRTGNVDRAKEIYADVVKYFPDTEKASTAQTYLAELNNQE